MEKNLVSKNLAENISLLKSKIGESFDINYRNFALAAIGGSEAYIVYVEGLVGPNAIDKTILGPLMGITAFSEEKKRPGNLRQLSDLLKYRIISPMAEESKSWDKICEAVMEGDTVLFVDNFDSALIMSTRDYDFREVTEPSVESEVRGPRDGFVEDILTNTAMIRRRIKDNGLRFDSLQIGDRTKTLVSVAYIATLVNDKLLGEVRARLERIKTESILASSYIEEMIEDKASIFPQIANTERPEKAAAAILEGRVVILVDNTPFALIVPAVFWQFILSSGDYYERFLLSTFIRWIRVLALFLSISLSSIYVLLTSFHQEMIPTVLALKIAQDRSGVPFPAVMEAFLMEAILEIMKEAGLHMPRAIGQTVSIVGTLVIGQAAVSAGLVSPLMVIVIAGAAISSYAIPAYNMSNSLRLVRFPLLFLSAVFGLFGFLAGLIALDLNLFSLRSFGVPYLSPLTPFEKSGIRDIFTRSPFWMMNKRPDFLRPKDVQRQPGDLKPRPPVKGKGK